MDAVLEGADFTNARLEGARMSKQKNSTTTTQETPMSNSQLESLRTDIEIQKLALELERLKGQIGHMGQVRTLQVELLKAAVDLVPDIKALAQGMLKKASKKLDA